MIWPIGTNIKKKTEDSLIAFLEHCFSLPEFRNQLGNKGVKVIVAGQNKPNQLHIELMQSGSRQPYTCGDKDEDGNYVYFWENEWRYGMQICVTDSDQSIPDDKVTKINVKTNNDNVTKLVEQISSERIKVSALTSIITYIFELNKYRDLLCEYGIYNVILKDESEMFSGTEYENTFSITFNTYVLIEI